MMIMPPGRSGVHKQTAGSQHDQREIRHCREARHRTDKRLGSTKGHKQVFTLGGAIRLLTDADGCYKRQSASE